MGPSTRIDGDALGGVYAGAFQELQWGRRLASTETRVHGQVLLPRRQASMGPSTRIDGDEVIAELRSVDVAMLQWGRRLASTETT